MTEVAAPMQEPAEPAHVGTCRAWPGWVSSELVQVIASDGGYPLDIGSPEHLLFIETLKATIQANEWGIHGTRRVFVDFLFNRAALLLRGSRQPRVDPPSDGSDSPLTCALVAQPFEHQAFFVKTLLQHGANVNRICASGIPREIADAVMPSLLESLRYMPGHPDFGDYPDLDSLGQVDQLPDSHTHLLNYECAEFITEAHAMEQMKLLNDILQGTFQMGTEWTPQTRAATVLELRSFYIAMDAETTQWQRPIATALVAEGLPHKAWVLRAIMSSSGNDGHSIDMPHPVLGGRTPRQVADTVMPGLLVELCDDDDDDCSVKSAGSDA